MGLYEDDNAAVTGGDVEAQEYWEARAAHAELEDALRTGQPVNAIAHWLPSAIAKLEAALEIYPNHADIGEWRVKAASVDRTVDPAYNTDWARGFPWSQQKFREGWIALHRARFLRATEPPEWKGAHVAARQVGPAWEKCVNLHDWPAEARALLDEGREEAKRIEDEARPRR